MATLAPLFLIGSFSFLQIMRTTINSRKSLNFCQIRGPTAELAALERLGNPHGLTMGDMLWPF